MTIITHKEFDRSSHTAGRFPRIALRQRSADHPMILFLLIVVSALIAMALVPPSGVAMSTFKDAPAAASRGDTSGEPASVGLSELEIACHGQAWGAESAECLAEIAIESGRPDGRPVRVIAGS